MLAVAQALSHVRPLEGRCSGDVRRLYPADTYRSVLAENTTPAGVRQTCTELEAVAAAVPRTRNQPPPLPTCPTIVLAAARPENRRERHDAHEHLRRHAESLPAGSYECIESAHLIQAEQPLVVGTRIRQLLEATPR